MCITRSFILLAVLFFFVHTTAAQERLSYLFRHINQSDGLLHNEVLSITQDDRGFLWIATRNGLQRYDGSRFTFYPEMLSNPAEGLTAGADIYADKEKKVLWVTNDVSIEKMELDKKRVTVYSPDDVTKHPDFNFSFYNEPGNRQWMLATNAVYYRDQSDKQNISLRYNIQPPGTHKSSFIAVDSTGNNTWLAINYRLFLLQKGKQTVASIDFNPLKHPLLQSSSYNGEKLLVRFVMIDSRQNIWVSTWGERLYRFDQKSQRVDSYSLADLKAKEQGGHAFGTTPLVNCLLEDKAGTIWAGTEQAGLLRYDAVKNNFDYCVAEEKSSEGILYDYKIFSLFQDKEDNIWVATDKGISIFNPGTQTFSFNRQHATSNSLISKAEINSFIQTTNGDIFTGTWGGGITQYDSNFHFKKTIFFNDEPDKNKIWCFTQTDNKTLWVGCQHGYLLQYDLFTGIIKTLHPAEMKDYTIRCMEKDGKGNIWFGLHNGHIVKWDWQQQTFLVDNDSPKTMPPVANILIDKSQRCWVSTEAGFKGFDLEKRVYTNTWLPDKKVTNSIAGRTCQGIEEYNDSILLIGTVYSGLISFNKISKVFSQLTAPGEVNHNTVYAIKKDAANNIWFTTNYGLYKFNYTDKKIVPYNIGPGIINSSFSASNFYPLQNGRWLTFTNTETISFMPAMVQQEGNKKSKTEIAGFRLFDKPVFIDSLLYDHKPVHLSYKENFITVEFAALNFSGVQQTNYYYRLNGVDKDWVNGGTKGFASYTNLQPGKYSFDVRAESGDNKGAITSFDIIVTPPFWKTWWFISAVSFAVLLFIYMFIKWREKNIKAIETEKQKVQELNAAQYKSQLELEQIINYFSSSLIDKNTVEDVLWDVAKNLIGRLGFVDCMMYLWNADKTRMLQKAGFGPKGSIEEIRKQPFDVLPGQGVVGYVMQTKEPLLISDTSKDQRYRPDEMERLSEITVPVIYNDELIGIIDSEHPDRNFYTNRHLQILSTIATLMGNKIKSIEAEQLLQQTNIEMYGINEQLLKAKLEALRAQMNPHFIFNCLTSIDNLIQIDEKEKATLYLSKFAKLIRSILENATSNVVPCWKDMETLKLYIELEELRWDKKFSYKVEIADEILNGDYKVPPLIIQPFVENAINHGLLNKIEGKKELFISVSAVNNQIRYLIEDNGVGRAKANEYKQMNRPSHQSMGMQITTDRINLFNQHENGFVKITDMMDEQEQPCGTRVIIELINQS